MSEERINLTEFTNKAWDILTLEGIQVPAVKIIESYEGEVLFVVEITNEIVHVLDARGTLFMIPAQYLVWMEDKQRYKAMKDKLLPQSEESLSEKPLANRVNKALLSVGDKRDSDANNKKALLNSMINKYHERFKYFDP